MQIGAINGTSFKGLIYSKKDNIAVNTDDISYMEQDFDKNNRTSITITKINLMSDIENFVTISAPLSKVLEAYKKAAESPENVVNV